MDRKFAILAVFLLAAVLGLAIMHEPPIGPAVISSLPDTSSGTPGANSSGDIPGAPFHIGVMTSTASQSIDSRLGAEELIRLYGASENGGMITHITYPENFMTEMETTIARIIKLANDPKMKVIVVNQAVPGTAEAFRLVREKRPDILCFAGEAHEDPEVVSKEADLVVNSDFISRGYLIPKSAKELGADTFVYISFPRHQIYDSVRRMREIMEDACRDLGLKFVYENAPDPTGLAGVDGARKYINDNFRSWLEKYGKNTAFYCTNDAETEPLLLQVAARGGIFIEADLPSPFMGYHSAFRINIEDKSGDWLAVRDDIEDAVMKAGAGGRMGTWIYSIGFCQTAGLAEFGKLVTEGRAYVGDTAKLLECFGKFSPGAKWNGCNYYDAEANYEFSNFFLVYQDTYIFGKGYLGVTDVKVPEKYLGEGAELKRSRFHIGIVTGDDSQSDDAMLGALEMKRLYGAAERGGMIRHAMYSNDFMEEMDTTINMITEMALDPKMKAIIVNQAVPGTAEAFRRVKDARPDIICMAGEAHEAVAVISHYADLAVNADFVSRGYLIPRTAKELGAKAFVHISFPRHMEAESIARRFAIMKQACEDLGMEFAAEEAPDPVGETGVEGAKLFIEQNFPGWLEKYGEDAAFFCTNVAHTEPLLKQIAKLGGYFVEASNPSPLVGYPGAFGLDLGEKTGNWQEILREVETAAVTAKAGGRLGTWAYSIGFCQTAGMAEFGKMIAEGRAEITDAKALLECFGKFSPGAKWNGSYFTDTVTGKPVRNYFLIY
ncbi:MAG: DUF3798 domain-containing protein, partial [Synergistaceae bacterium]|nr:DUF3798 domain-containing protein [Synergistaceae bacterium]